MMSMKEACEYVKNSRIARATKHRIEVTQGDFITGFTNKEYRKVKSPMRRASRKGRTFSHTKLWEGHNYSNNIHTIYHDGTLKNR